MSIFSFGQSLNPDSQCVERFYKKQGSSEPSKLEIKNRQGFNILLNPLRGKSPEFLVTSPYGEVYTVTLLLIEKLGMVQKVTFLGNKGDDRAFPI